jgi:hypothetical protein
LYRGPIVERPARYLAQHAAGVAIKPLCWLAGGLVLEFDLDAAVGKVAGSWPMPARAMAAQVEKQQGWLSSPWQRITKALERLWPLFKTPRSSSFSLTKCPVSEYTYPMHPEGRRDHPGNCPKCGMALEPAAPAPTAATTEYVCPMHPEIMRSEPGNCPICGMALEPRVGVAEEAESELVAMT